MPKLFGTDGIRGIANQDPITAEQGQKLGRALVSFCKDIYFELGCEVKGLGRGHVKRIKDEVREEREHMYLQMNKKAHVRGA